MIFGRNDDSLKKGNKNSYSIKWESNYRALVIKVTGFLSHENYKACWTKALDEAENNEPLFLLIDLKESAVITLENREWLQEVYFPRLYRLPNFDKLEVVRVLSSGAFGQISIHNIDKTRTEKDSHIKKESVDFKSFEMAMAYIKRQYAQISEK